MNILILNGSPKGEGSITMRLTQKFLEGVREAKPDCLMETILLRDAEIEHCRGCEACWGSSPGKCVINDQGNIIHEKYLAADLIIWSFPLYTYGAPSKAKACMDRLTFPSLMPQMFYDRDGIIRHPWRFKGRHERQILISSSGFPQIEGNYDALLRQMNVVNPNITNFICCGAPALFLPGYEKYRERMENYLEDMQQAGLEYLRNDGRISRRLLTRLKEPLVPPEEFMDIFNSNFSWNYKDNR